jgi:hypothetical protein
MYLLSNVVDMIIVASSAGFVKHSTKKGEKMVGLGNEINGWRYFLRFIVCSIPPASNLIRQSCGLTEKRGDFGIARP